MQLAGEGGGDGWIYFAGFTCDHNGNALFSGLPVARRTAGLNASKQLTETQREKYFEFLTTCAEIEFAIAAVDAGEIDEINICKPRIAP